MAFSEMIDAHQHFWKTSRGDYAWMQGLPDASKQVLGRDFLPSELKPELDKSKVSRTVLVQAAATEAEGRYLLELADSFDWIAGVVVWLDLESDAFPKQLASFRAEKKFVGVRPMIESMEDPRWMLRAQVQKNLGHLADQGVCIDFLTHPKHLPFVFETLTNISGLRAVIDHISKPNMAEQQVNPWNDDIARVAEFPNLCCKLSGMVTEAAPGTLRATDLKPFISHVVSHFGPKRCMFGSDWPVCLLRASYAEVKALLEENLENLSEKDKKQIFFQTAKDFYQLE